ncbi:MAG: PfkB family carbohydrate kinase [Planctomycetia bacterium]|nr:PfkB family carbohydrate kinase [Planctomycetia bacterium]
MSLLILGSAAYDSIETPNDRREKALGGSGVHSAYAARFFTGVQLISVVGDDWASSDTKLLQDKGIDTKGLELRQGSKTLAWSGKYFDNMNDRETLDIQLNVMGQEYNPIVPDSFKDTKFVFLANGGPGIHLSLLKQLHSPQLIVADTMDFYINNDREMLLALLTKINGLILNDSEAKQLTGLPHCISAAQNILEKGPQFVIIKKGEHGAMYFSHKEIYLVPAYPTENVVDPTGAGDSFAGGFMGYLSSVKDLSPQTVKKALVYATVIASFNVEGFSLERLTDLCPEELENRFQTFRKMIC